jgi:hypothetical protein
MSDTAQAEISSAIKPSCSTGHPAPSSPYGSISFECPARAITPVRLRPFVLGRKIGVAADPCPESAVPDGDQGW